LRITVNFSFSIIHLNLIKIWYCFTLYHLYNMNDWLINSLLYLCNANWYLRHCYFYLCLRLDFGRIYLFQSDYFTNHCCLSYLIRFFNHYFWKGAYFLNLWLRSSLACHESSIEHLKNPYLFERFIAYINHFQRVGCCLDCLHLHRFCICLRVGEEC
jgi:hypothetical protein